MIPSVSLALLYLDMLSNSRMAFLHADTFQVSLDLLSSEEQKASKLAAFELQMNPPTLACSATDWRTSETSTSGQPEPAVYTRNLSPRRQQRDAQLR
jgi:hypothetical protein